MPDTDSGNSSDYLCVYSASDDDHTCMVDNENIPAGVPHYMVSHKAGTYVYHIRSSHARNNDEAVKLVSG